MDERPDRSSDLLADDPVDDLTEDGLADGLADDLTGRHATVLGLLAAGDADGAVAAAEDWADSEPEDWQAQRVLAEALLRRGAKGDLAEAYRSAERSCSLAPDLAAPHTTFGLVRSLAGDQSGARTAYRRALELDGDHAPALHNLALQQLSQGRPGQAARSLSLAWPASLDGPAADADPTQRAAAARIVAVALASTTVVGAVLDLSALLITTADSAAGQLFAGVSSIAYVIAAAALAFRLRSAEPRLLSLAGGTARSRITQAAASIVILVEAAILLRFLTYPGLPTGSAAPLLLVPICVAGQALLVALVGVLGRGQRLLRWWWLRRSVAGH